jgi:hypothetical protein
VMRAAACFIWRFPGWSKLGCPSRVYTTTLEINVRTMEPTIYPLPRVHKVDINKPHDLIAVDTVQVQACFIPYAIHTTLALELVTVVVSP